ncbi:Outer membrane porin protein 32 precursor [compost metagenome]
MKKYLTTLTALIACAASAQSSITLFGVVDAAIVGYSSRSKDMNHGTPLNPFYINRGDVKIRRTALINSGYNSSRLGFRGTEDLGGGLAASFWLEAPISNDDGQTGVATFSRRSTVSLSGGFGEIRLGRDYNPTFWNDAVFDPFGLVGPGASLMFAANTSSPGGTFKVNSNYVRASNSIGYFLPPNLGGFYGQAMYGFHENNSYSPGTATPPGVSSAGLLNSGAVSATRAGRFFGGRLGFAKGPLDIAAAYSSSISADNYYAGTSDLVKTANFGASYDFKLVKVFGEVSRVKYERDHKIVPIGDGMRDINFTGYVVGATVPIGAGLIRFAYSQVKYDLNLVQPPFARSVGDPMAKQFALGYVHNLSRRTALYATVARVSNKNGAALTVAGPAPAAPAFTGNPTYTPRASTGYAFGIRHAF